MKEGSVAPRGRCLDCGGRTYKGKTRCSYCVKQTARKLKSCHGCGSVEFVLRHAKGKDVGLCDSCFKTWQVNRFLETAGPIFQRGGSMTDIGHALGISRERVRQILRAHPELAILTRKTKKDQAGEVFRSLLEQGLTFSIAARRCGLNTGRRELLDRFPELAQLAERNERIHQIQRFEALFRLVEQEGISLAAAGLRLGIRCKMKHYRLARTEEALQQYPGLARIPVRAAKRTRLKSHPPALVEAS